MCRTACMQPVARPCRTAPFSPMSHVPALSGAGVGHIVGRVGRKEGRATLSACKRAASAHAPPSAPTCVRACAPACLRACMRALLRRKMRVLRWLSSQRPTWVEVVWLCDASGVSLGSCRPMIAREQNLTLLYLDTAIWVRGRRI